MRLHYTLLTLTTLPLHMRVQVYRTRAIMEISRVFSSCAINRALMSKSVRNDILYQTLLSGYAHALARALIFREGSGHQTMD